MKKIDFVGQKIGKLTVVRGTELPKYKSCKYAYLEYECVCDCNLSKQLFISVYQLAKNIQSCGCLKILSNLTDLIKPGDKFNRLTVIGFDLEKQLWEYKCDCGNTLFAGGKVVRNGNTKSCGCLNTEKRQQKAINMINNKTNPNTKLVIASKIWKNNYHDGDITLDQFISLSQLECSYCGAFETCHRIKNPSKHSYLSKLSEEELTFRYNGLDRIDTNLPHNLDNCITACIICNRAKNDYTIDEFISHLKLMVKNRLHNNVPIDEYRELHHIIDSAFFSDRKTYYSKIASINYTHPTRYNDIDFDIPTFYQLTQLPCFYCGSDPKNYVNKALNKRKSGRAATDYAVSTGDYFYNGLDRINSDLPHIYSNVIPCCHFCNFAKGKLTLDQFYSWLDRIANYLFPELSSVEAIIEYRKNR